MIDRMKERTTFLGPRCIGAWIFCGTRAAAKVWWSIFLICPNKSWADDKAMTLVVQALHDQCWRHATVRWHRKAEWAPSRPARCWCKCVSGWPGCHSLRAVKKSPENFYLPPYWSSASHWRLYRAGGRTRYLKPRMLKLCWPVYRSGARLDAS